MAGAMTFQLLSFLVLMDVVSSSATIMLKYDPSTQGEATFPRLWDTAPFPDRSVLTANYLMPVSATLVQQSPKWDWPTANTDPYTTRISMVRVLGGWTNDTTGENDLAFRFPNGTIGYRWELLHERLAPVVNNSLTPVMVLDNVPWCFSANGTAGTYGNVFGPTNFTEYRIFIEAVVDELLTHYGDVAKTWEYRVGTEPNCACHWQDTVLRWFEYYDYVTAAVRSLIPTATVFPGNFCSMCVGKSGNGTETAANMAAHIGSGTNYVTGKIGSPIDKIGLSVYGGRHLGYNPSEVAAVIAEQGYGFRKLASPNNLSIPLEFYEFGMLYNPFKRLSDEPGAYGGAWTASVWINSYAMGVTRMFHWGGIDIIRNRNLPACDPGCHIARSHAWDMAVGELLVGGQASVLTSSAPIAEDANFSVSAIGVRHESNKSYAFMVSSFDYQKYWTNDTVEIDITIAGITQDRLSIKQYTLDHSNSVYEMMYADLEKIPGALQFNDGRLYGIGEMTTLVGKDFVVNSAQKYLDAQGDSLQAHPFTGTQTVTSEGLVLSFTAQVHSVHVFVFNDPNIKS